MLSWSVGASLLVLLGTGANWSRGSAGLTFRQEQEMFLVSKNMDTGPGAHPASYPARSDVKRPGDHFDQLHLMLKLTL